MKKFVKKKRRMSRGDHAKRIAAARMSRKGSAPIGERAMAARKSAGGY